MKSFLSGRSKADASTLHATPGGTTPPSFGARVTAGGVLHKDHAQSPNGPTVECIKQGDKIMRLIVTCSCGERIEVECLYPAGG